MSLPYKYNLSNITENMQSYANLIINLDKKIKSKFIN
jgi:hypothetical protein